jgi:sodium transport system permease protein
VLLALLSVVLTSAMVGGISIFLCGKAKTFKEAQSKVSFLSMISLVPMFTDMMNVNSNVLYMIPIASGGTILNDIFLKGLTMEHMLIFIATSIVVTVVAIFVVSKQYKDEKALF